MYKFSKGFDYLNISLERIGLLAEAEVIVLFCCIGSAEYWKAKLGRMPTRDDISWQEWCWEAFERRHLFVQIVVVMVKTASHQGSPRMKAMPACS